MFFPHGIIISEVEGTGRNKSTLFDKVKNKCSMWNIKKRMIKMMNLREIKAMLKSEFGIKYLYELSQVDLIQNNEDLVLGIVKVELQVSHKRYVLGTFNVWNAHKEVSKRQVKKYMAYFDKIETWFADKQEVDVRVFNDEQYQYTRKVKRIEVVPYETIEETQEEQQNEQSQKEVVPCETQEETQETIEPLLSLGDDIATQVFTSDHTSAPMFMSNQLKKMIDTILYENNTDSFGTCKIAVYDHVDENKKPIYGIHVLENDYMIEFDKNTQAVTKIYENEFGFECGLSLATRDYIFNPLMKIIADEIETIYNGLER